MRRLGSRRDLKGQYLSSTLLVLNILIKYKSDLQRSILGTAVLLPSLLSPFFWLLPVVSVDPASEDLQSPLGAQLIGP